MIRNISIRRLIQHPRVFSSTHSPTLRYSSSIADINSSSDSDKLLRHDIKLLGQKLGEAIKSESTDVYDAVEKLRKLGRQVHYTTVLVFTACILIRSVCIFCVMLKWRSPDGKKEAFDEMVTEVKSYDAQKLIRISRAFTHFLALSNSAENHHRIRRLKSSFKDSNYALPSKEDSCAGSIRRLLGNGSSADDIFAALCSQQVEIVLTGNGINIQIYFIFDISSVFSSSY